MTPIEQFQRALVMADDEHQFQHVPVDWWDAPAQVWRPSVLEAVSGDAHTRVHAEIVAPVETPDAVDFVAKRVLIQELRPSLLLDEGLAEFFTTRYTLELLESLMPCIERASSSERRALNAILCELLETYETSFKVWTRAFSTGSAAGTEPCADVWTERAVASEQLPHAHIDLDTVDLFDAVGGSADGSLDCAPVALWDEAAGRWRPTMLLNATGDMEQFLPRSRIQVLVPGDPVAVRTVSGSLACPLDLADSCFSLVALPILARDCLRMHGALRSAGFGNDEVAAHPFMIAFVKMLAGAADEWGALFEEGLEGAAPEPRVDPLAPELWGMAQFGPRQD